MHLSEKKIGKISGYFGRNINEMETFKLIEILGKKTLENDQINLKIFQYVSCYNIYQIFRKR